MLKLAAVSIERIIARKSSKQLTEKKKKKTYENYRVCEHFFFFKNSLIMTTLDEWTIQ